MITFLPMNLFARKYAHQWTQYKSINLYGLCSKIRNRSTKQLSTSTIIGFYEPFQKWGGIGAECIKLKWLDNEFIRKSRYEMIYLNSKLLWNTLFVGTTVPYFYVYMVLFEMFKRLLFRTSIQTSVI